MVMVTLQDLSGLDLSQPWQAKVIPATASGSIVAGSLAEKMRKQERTAWLAYTRDARAGKLRPGTGMVSVADDGTLVLWAVTRAMKLDFARLTDVAAAFSWVRSTLLAHSEVEVAACPLLGMNEGLYYPTVLALAVDALDDIDCKIHLFSPPPFGI